MTDYLDQLSEFAVSTRFESLNQEAIAATKNVIMDTIGAMVAGSQLPENANLAKLAVRVSSKGKATLIGHGSQVQPMFAALVNATAGVGLEMDEGNRFGGGHPGIHVIPGAVAVAEEMDLGGQALIESILVGYEVCSRIGGATTPRSNVHSHGTWGTIGTAVAVARLRGFGQSRMREVINLASSMSPANSWTPCFEGATIRNLYPGRSGFQGVLAVELQECGYTALEDGPSDIYSTILGEQFDLEAVIRGLDDGDAYRIQQNYFKFHACCLFNHPALDVVAKLLQQEEFSAEDVDWVRVTSIPFASRMAQGYPENMLSAKFHIPYAVGALLVRRKTDVTSFYPDAVADPRIRDLVRKVQVYTDPQMNMRRSDYPSAQVSVGLRDGRVLSGNTTVVKGDASNPVPHQALVDKFLFLTTDILGLARSHQVLEALGRLEGLRDLKELTSLLGND